MPFAGFDDWDDCMSTMTNEEGYNEDAAERICGALQAEAKSEYGDPEELWNALKDAGGMILDGTLDLVSGVDVPAIDSKWVMMKADRSEYDWETTAPILLSKADDDGEGEEDRLSFAPAMIPREPDKEGEVVPTATVEKMAHGFLKKGGGIDTDHSLIEGDGEPVESWILKEDRTFDLPGGKTETYPAGTWMLGVQWEAEPWERIKAGELSGLSIYGKAETLALNNQAKAKAVENCPNCGVSIAEYSQNADKTKPESDKTEDKGSNMTDTEPEGESADGQDADGPDIETIADRLGELESTIETLEQELGEGDESGAETGETEKQDPQEAAAVLGDEYDIRPGDVLDILNAAEDADADAVLEAIESISASAEESDGEETEKSEGEEVKQKGHDEEGVRAETIAEKQASGGSKTSFQSLSEQEVSE